jgi:hypothetical protein
MTKLICFPVFVLLFSCAMSWPPAFDGLSDRQDDSGGPAGDCPPGLASCGGTCVDLSSDHDHCGECDHRCGPPEVSSEVCNDGECVAECTPGKVACSGGCVDISNDIFNCGECGRTCSAGENAEPVCESRACTVICDVGWSDRDGDGSCETNCVPSSPTETCDGIDNNCNGEIDEGFECRPGQEVSCTTVCGSTGRGICGLGCEVPDPASCNPPSETCNGLDDDCDGACDSGLGCCRGEIETGACGDCGTGTKTRTCSASCTWGPWSACAGGGVCSPGATQSQSCGSYDCGTHTRSCDSSCEWGRWSSCDVPSEECNSGDDDCDYSVDELVCPRSVEFPAPPVSSGSTISVITRYPAGVVCVGLRVDGPTGVFYGEYQEVIERGPPRWAWRFEVRIPAAAGTYHFSFRHQNLCSSPCTCPVETSPVQADLVVE